jgi:hypothetical protein
MLSNGMQERELERTLGLLMADDQQTQRVWRNFADRFAEQQVRPVVIQVLREIVLQILSLLALILASAAAGIAIYFRVTHWPTH